VVEPSTRSKARVCTPAAVLFVRLAGCAVGCPWCDTKHSWPEAAHPRLSLLELARQARQAIEAGAAFIVITGGELLQHDLGPLSAALEGLGPLPLETSDVDPLRGRFDWITLSPPRHRPPPRAELLAACHELKVVVHGAEDLEFAQAMAAMGGSTANGPQLLLQQGWNSPAGQALAVAFVQSHPDWRLSLQSHKWLRVR